MVITRTPFRISFFGGGTDYPAWYLEHGGAVVATAINRYCYLSCRRLPPFFSNRHRVVYSKNETVNELDEITHPAAREVMRYVDLDCGLSIHHDGDLPARSGVGSSSSYTVGLLHALYALKGRMMSKLELAQEAIHIEREVLKETVGSQDQVVSAFGGFNHIRFLPSGNFQVTPVVLPPGRAEEFQSHLMLFFTGISRTASTIAQSYVQGLAQKNTQMRRMLEMVDEALAILGRRDGLEDFGRLLHESWLLKRSLGDRISTAHFEELYESARGAGALGGKLLGAGGGGFMLLFVPPPAQAAVSERLSRLIRVPFETDLVGSQIIYYDPSQQ